MDERWNTIRQGDCIAGMQSLPAGTVDLVFADPPFNIGYEYDVYDDSQERTDYLSWSKQWIAEVHRVLSPTGTFWLAIGDEYAAELKLASQEIGFHCRNWVVWYYTFGVHCTRKFTRSHAHLFYFVKDPQSFTFNDSAVRVPSARQLVYADSRANPAGRLPDDTWILRPQDLHGSLTAEEDTWYFPRVAGTFKERAGFHGCQMPEQLLGRIIRACSKEGDLILDPFSGSATTLVVAKKIGRKFLGFELSPEYAERGMARLANVRVGDQLDGSPEPLVSAPATSSGKNGPRAKPLTSQDKAAADLKDATDRGVIEAFQASSEGFSADRVLADPCLNAAFQERCHQLGLAGDARSWNYLLFGLRKTGKLSHIPTTRRTELSWKDCDCYLFASEIALQKTLEAGASSLDDILCDPDFGKQFDNLAASLAPGYTTLNYRLAALKLRKKAKDARSRAAVLAAARLNDPIRFRCGAEWKQLSEAAGVYLVLGPKDESLYVGETLDLRTRIVRQFSGPQQAFWEQWSGDLRLRTYTPGCAPEELIAYQSKLVRKHKPLLNFKELAC